MDSKASRQKTKFTEWFKNQHQRFRPNKFYSDSTADAAIHNLESGLSKLNIPEYENVNCFSITKADEFKNLYDKCYDAAKRVDEEQKNRYFRNGLEFYMLFLDHENHETYHAKELFIENIQYLIKEYKRRFDVINQKHEEVFKWQAIDHYENYWEIEDDDFAGMYRESFIKAKGLLGDKRYNIFDDLQELAKSNPQKVKELFIYLYDETKTLEDRYTFWEKELQKLPTITDKKINLRSIIFYLVFHDPKKYYLYKPQEINDFMKLYGYVSPLNNHHDKTFKYQDYEYMCDIILEEVKKDSEIIELNKQRVEGLKFQDEDLHILVSDLIYFGAKHLIDELNAKDQNQGVEVSSQEKNDNIEKVENMDKNIIFYGPPGTGKTYNTVIKAVAIMENTTFEALQEKIKDKTDSYDEILRRYKKYKNEDRIAFTTFHQSYGYEEFIEGIKPKVDAKGNIAYGVASGHFKKFCSYAQLPIQKVKRKVWMVNRKCLGQQGLEGHKCIDLSILNITDKASKKAFDEEMQAGDFVLVDSNNNTIGAIGILQEKTGDDEKIHEVKWLCENLQEAIRIENDNKYISPETVIYEMKTDSLEYIYEILIKHEYKEATDKPFVFIIDEINRGNISKIFGELITLIEDSKRLGESEGMTVKLPYSGEEFGIPNNVYIIGTMNTADRSIALMDTALRRRFSFEEMMPKPELLDKVKVDEISIGQLLRDMNEKITVLYDREHTIGHAYFMPLVKELKEKERFKLLGEIFKNKIIPLLQEYFYDDYAKIRLVLGDDKAGNTPQFIKKNSSKAEILFGKTNVEKFGLEGTIVYSINDDAFKSKEAYNHILNTPVKISKEDKETPNPNDGAPNATIEDNEKQDKLASPKPSEGTKS